MNKKRWLLVISLVLNVFFLSLIAGKWINQNYRATPSINALIKTLPAETKEVLRQEIKPKRRELAKAVYQFRQSRRQVAELLKQETLDDIALAESMKETQQHLNQIMDIFQTVLIGTSKQLSHEQRLEWSKQWQPQNKQGGFLKPTQLE